MVSNIKRTTKVKFLLLFDAQKQTEKINLLTRNELKAIKGGSESEESEYADEGSGSPKIDACKGKPRGAACSWDYNGTRVNGNCTSHYGGSLYCSDLN